MPTGSSTRRSCSPNLRGPDSAARSSAPHLSARLPAPRIHRARLDTSLRADPSSIVWPPSFSSSPQLLRATASATPPHAVSCSIRLTAAPYLDLATSALPLPTGHCP